jgi:hypothetical protein
MKEPTRKLQHRTDEQTQEETHAISSQAQTVKEFNSVEELIRHDAAGVSVPAAVAEKLRDSIQKEPPEKPWWQRLLGQ